jgi:predicted Zn-dependent peptidase
MTEGQFDGGRGSRTASPSTLPDVVLEADVRVTTLDNGLRVLTERVPGVRSAAAGVWVIQGVAHEAPEIMGASHMLEHMVFKGTRARSAREIALSLESLGGSWTRTPPGSTPPTRPGSWTATFPRRWTSSRI